MLGLRCRSWEQTADEKYGRTTAQGAAGTPIQWRGSRERSNGSCADSQQICSPAERQRRMFDPKPVYNCEAALTECLQFVSPVDSSE